MIKVFLVDDSATVRQVLTDILKEASDIELIGAAQDPIFALRKLEKIWPDVFILDIEMPRMDGLSFLQKIMAERPTPVVMCSTLTEKGSAVSIKALSYGAVEVVEKPKSNLKGGLLESSEKLIRAVKAAAVVNLKAVTRNTRSQADKKVKPRFNIDQVMPKTRAKPQLGIGHKYIAIGSSTGGTLALESILTQLPEQTPGIAIVQHMPEYFTKAFADRLNKLCAMRVKEAESNDELKQGVVLIAPGGKHMVLVARGNRVFAEIKDAPPVNRHRPSVDVLFRSAAKIFRTNALGVILTGMGNDGARGLKEMRDAGANTIAQNEESCVVYGMPAEAVKLGAAAEIHHLDHIAEQIINF